MMNFKVFTSFEPKEALSSNFVVLQTIYVHLRKQVT